MNESRKVSASAGCAEHRHEKYRSGRAVQARALAEHHGQETGQQSDGGGADVYEYEGVDHVQFSANQIGSRLRRSRTAAAMNAAANASPIQRPGVLRNFPGVSDVSG